MIEIYYAIIVGFFLIGALGIFMANRKRNAEGKRQNWIKYGVYFIITNILFASIIFIPVTFPYLCALISAWGLVEIIRLQYKEKCLKRFSFLIVLCIYLFFCSFFILFGCLQQEVLLLTVFTVLAFDAFCQIAGQIMGKTQICPTISPNKTWEGLIGGTVISVFTCGFIGYGTGFIFPHAILLGLGICVFSFAGDLSASWLKRQYGIKDFGSSLPGHGGFLDRFDSLIPAGCFVILYILSRCP